MRRREFLKLLAATTLGTFGTPLSGIRRALGDNAGPKMKLKEAVERLKDDPRRFVFLLGSTFAQTQADLRLCGAAVYYYSEVGGNVNGLIRQATKLRGEPGVAEFLGALRDSIGFGANTETFTCSGRDFYGNPRKHRRLVVEARLIMSVWTGRTPAEELGRAHGRSVGVEILAAYVENYGSTLVVLEVAETEIVLDV